MRILSNPAILVAGILALFGLLLSSFWTGYLASDDALYWAAAGKWLVQFPYIGDSHWALRQTLVLPMALARAVLGSGPVAMVLPTILYSIALLVMLTLWLRSLAGTTAALVGGALIATNPQIITWSSTADIDPVKMFFVLAATIGYLHAMKPRTGMPWGALLGSGALAGLGYLSHETSLFAVAAIGLLFLGGYGMPRVRYLPMGAAFAAVLACELLAMWVGTGDPLHRHRPTINLTHDATISRWVDQGATVPILHPLIDPVTMLLMNQSFGLLAWIGVPLSVWLLRTRKLGPAAQRAVIVLAAIAVVWSLLSAGLWKVLPLTPRYFLMPAVIVSILAGIAIAELVAMRRNRLAWTLAGAMLAANVAAVALSNRDLMFGENTLADIAATQGEIINTDPRTRLRADVILEWRGVSTKVVATPPKPGDLFFINPLRLPRDFAVNPAWQVVTVYDPPARPLASFVLRYLPAGIIPDKVLRKFTIRQPEVTLYRVR